MTLLSSQILYSAAAKNELFSCKSGVGDSSPICQCSKVSSLKAYLCEIWDDLLGGLALSDEDASSLWFEKLWNLHCEPTRFYHTAVHLEELCYLLNLLTTNADSDGALFLSKEDQQVLLLSIFFHDAIYNAKSSTNEQDSAELFLDFFTSIAISHEVNSLLKKRVEQFILATQQHRVSPENAESLALFLDLDMAVLGKQPSAYLAYAALVRKEYAFVPRDIYCEKRVVVLKQFLKGPIYGISLIRQALEESARANITAEIALLEQNIIPGEDTAKR